MTSGAARTAATARGSRSAAPVATTTAALIRCSFLRRHYPVQVLGSAAATALSAHRSSELPVLVDADSTAAGGVGHGEGHQPADHQHHARDLRRADRFAEHEIAPADGERRLGDLEDADRGDVDVAL